MLNNDFSVTEYMKELNLKPLKSIDLFYGAIAKKFGDDYACIITGLIENNAYKGANMKNFYKVKNQSLEKSLAITGFFEFDVIENFLTWIDDNSDIFGENILEVGCDIGIISCFLALKNPNSKITSIDLCQEAINNAKLLAEKLDINNIEFRCVDVKSLKDIKFDTVLSIRTMHENFEKDFDEEDVNLKDFSELVDIYKNIIIDYSKTLCDLVEEDGLLITIERLAFNPLLVGWYNSLVDNKIEIEYDDCDFFEAIESDHKSPFAAILGIKNSESSNLKYLPVDAMINSYYQKNKKYDGWYAQAVCSKLKKELIVGYKLYKNGKQVGERSLWTMDESNLFINYNNIIDFGEGLDMYPIKRLDEAKELIDTEINNDKRNGYIVKEIKI